MSSSAGGGEGTYGSGQASSATRASSRSTARSVRVRRVGGGVEEHVLDQEEPLAEVVEGGHVAREREHGVGQARVVGGHVREPLDLAHDVVAEIADDSPVERRELRDGRRPVRTEQRFERVQGALVRRQTGRRRALELDLPAAHDHRQRRVTTEEGEPAPALSVLDRLEQEARRSRRVGPDQLHERRDRRLEVGQDLAPYGHDVVVARQLDELDPRGSDGGLHYMRPGAAPPPNARKKQLRSPVWHAPAPSCSTTNSSVSASQS